MNTTAIDIKEYPILFTGPMVRAILDGTKTQTRRIIKPQPGESAHLSFDPHEDHWYADGLIADCKMGPWRCPYGQPGDRLWVRETQRVLSVGKLRQLGGGAPPRRAIRVKYEADGASSGLLEYPDRLKGNPVEGRCLSYGGYRESSRLTLEVVSVRVERVQEISDGDAYAEGTDEWAGSYLDQKYGKGGGSKFKSVRAAYEVLWDSINAKRGPKVKLSDLDFFDEADRREFMEAHKRGYAWAMNPRVWVIEFKRIDDAESGGGP